MATQMFVSGLGSAGTPARRAPWGGGGPRAGMPGGVMPQPWVRRGHHEAGNYSVIHMIEIGGSSGRAGSGTRTTTTRTITRTVIQTVR